MKYDKMLPGMRHLQVCGCMMYSEKQGPCTICGNLTHFIEINYEGWFCSSECMDIFEKNMRKDGAV